MRNFPLRTREAFVDFSAEELKFMRKLKVGELTVEPGTTVIMEGNNSPQLFTVLDGMGTRFQTLSGGRRQTVNFIFPGDFIGLQASVMNELTYSVEAATPMKLCVFNRSDIWALTKNFPARAYDMTWLAAAEEHFMGAANGKVSQGTAVQIISWAMMRIFQRGTSLGLVENGQMAFPFRQQDLADTLSLSLVHTNKTLAILRQKGLAHWMDGILRVDNLDALAEAAETEYQPLSKRRVM